RRRGRAGRRARHAGGALAGGEEVVTDRPPSRPTRRRVGPDDGSVTVFVADERAAGRAPELAVDAPRWVGLAEAVLEAEGVRGEAELSVLFVEADVIAELNEAHLGHAGPTDVLSFPLDGEQAAA